MSPIENESFNHLLWSLCRKEQYVSPLETSRALSLSVCVYNSGLNYTTEKLFEMAEINTPTLSVQCGVLLTKKGLRTVNGLLEDTKMKRRLRKRQQIKGQDAFQRNEGVQYKPQGFHTNEK